MSSATVSRHKLVSVSPTSYTNHQSARARHRCNPIKECKKPEHKRRHGRCWRQAYLATQNQTKIATSESKRKQPVRLTESYTGNCRYVSVRRAMVKTIERIGLPENAGKAIEDIAREEGDVRPRTHEPCRDLPFTRGADLTRSWARTLKVKFALRCPTLRYGRHETRDT